MAYLFLVRCMRRYFGSASQVLIVIVSSTILGWVVITFVPGGLDIVEYAAFSDLVGNGCLLDCFLSQSRQLARSFACDRIGGLLRDPYRNPLCRLRIGTQLDTA
jgi:hypothetical protein